MLRRACESIHLAMAHEKRPLESRISQSPQKPSPESKAPCQKKINYRNRVAWPGALEFGHVLLQRSPFLPPTSRVKGQAITCRRTYGKGCSSVKATQADATTGLLTPD